MKQFTKFVSLIAGLVVLLGIGFFATKGIIAKNNAVQSGPQTVLTGADTQNAAKAVPAPEDDEIVTIDEDSVITDEYHPIERDAIPIGPGAQATQTGAEAAVKILYQAGTVFLQEEEHAQAARDTLEELHRNIVTLGNVAGDPGSETLSAAFFDFLGTSDDPAYADCGITISNAEGVVYTASSYSRVDNVVAVYSVAMKPSADMMVKTECTAVTTYGEEEDVTVSSYVITRMAGDGATTETYSTTKTEPKT